MVVRAPRVSHLLLPVFTALTIGSCSSDTPEGTANTNTDARADSATEDAASLPPRVDLGPASTHDEPWLWLEYDDGTSAGSHSYTDLPDGTYEYVRFESWAPTEIRAIRVQARIAQTAVLRVYVWDDFGGDRVSLDSAAPLAVLERPVTPGDTDSWLELPVEPVLRLQPGRLFYAGVIVTGDGPQLRVDTEQPVEDDTVPHSLVWQSTQRDPEAGTYTVYGAAMGDYLLRVDARQVDVVAPEDQDFERADPTAIGFSGLRGSPSPTSMATETTT